MGVGTGLLQTTLAGTSWLLQCLVFVTS